MFLMPLKNSCPEEVCHYCYSDGAPEIDNACKEHYIKHGKSTPGVPQTNAEIETRVRLVTNGARVALETGGAPNCFWPFAARHYCMTRNIRMVKGDSAWNKRTGKGHFTGPRIPFFHRIQFFPSPTSTNVESRWGVGVLIVFSWVTAQTLERIGR